MIGLGVLLRIWQLSADASFWLDELALIRNIVDQPLPDLLFDPLEFGQMAPAGFLALSRWFWIVAQGADGALRILPFVASVATIPLIYLIGRRLLSPVAAVGATALIAFSPSLVILGGIAKQYSLDIAVTTALMYGGLILIERTGMARVSLAGVGVAGGTLLLFSFPAALAAFAIALLLVVHWYVDERDSWLSRAIALGLPLGTGAAVTTIHALKARSPETGAFLSEYWQAGFAPNVWTVPVWAWHQLAGVWDTTFLTPYPWPGRHTVLPMVMVGLCVIGGFALATRQRVAALVVVAPIFAALVAACVGFYPVEERLAVFLAPSLALLTAAGAATLGQMASSRFEHIASATAVLPVVPVLLALATTPPPVRLQETRPMLADLSREWRTGDVLYSYFAANQAVAYYGPRFGLSDWRPGLCTALDDVHGQLEQIDELAGHSRVWVVFTHVLPESRVMIDGMLARLRENGIERQALLDYRKSFGTSAYLFDLSVTMPGGIVDRSTNTEMVAAATCGAGPAANWRGTSPS